jgi:hypothetical protein
MRTFGSSEHRSGRIRRIRLLPVAHLLTGGSHVWRRVSRQPRIDIACCNEFRPLSLSLDDPAPFFCVGRLYRPFPPVVRSTADLVLNSSVLHDTIPIRARKPEDDGLVPSIRNVLSRLAGRPASGKRSPTQTGILPIRLDCTAAIKPGRVQDVFWTAAVTRRRRASSATVPANSGPGIQRRLFCASVSRRAPEQRGFMTV